MGSSRPMITSRREGNINRQNSKFLHTQSSIGQSALCVFGRSASSTINQLAAPRLPWQQKVPVLSSHPGRCRILLAMLFQQVTMEEVLDGGQPPPAKRTCRLPTWGSERQTARRREEASLRTARILLEDLQKHNRQSRLDLCNCRIHGTHETDSYTNLSDSVCCVQLLFLDSFIEPRN